MGLLIPYVNEGTKPDIAALSGKTGLDIKTAKDLYQMINDKFDGG